MLALVLELVELAAWYNFHRDYSAKRASRASVNATCAPFPACALDRP
jgi:hypothetical protein